MTHQADDPATLSDDVLAILRQRWREMRDRTQGQVTSTGMLLHKAARSGLMRTAREQRRRKQAQAQV